LKSRIGSRSFWIDAIELALSHEAVKLARRFAQRAQALYPDNEQIQRFARVLDSPKVIETNRAPRDDQAASMRWLHDHSAEYAGSWVALKNGILLGNATTRKELVEHLSSDANGTSVMITRIP
jgi:hypothetical protein